MPNFDAEWREITPVYKGTRGPLTKADAESMMLALRYPALIYVLHDGSCLIQGHCSRLSTNHRFFTRHNGEIPECQEEIELLPEGITA